MTHTVAVVGGGAAGVMTVVRLARAWPRDRELRVLLYDGSPRPARGLAYSTTDPAHLLNVPVGRISAIAEEPDHFLHWVRRRDPKVDRQDFRPRAEYGDYLADTLADHAPGAGLVVRRICVRDVTRSGNRYRILHDAGADDADAVVLALGYGPPSRLSGIVSADAPGYVADPWRPDAMAQLAQWTCPGDTVLTIGCGLTGVDVALSLKRRDRRVVAVSRHGMVPAPHRWPLPEPWPATMPVPAGPLSVEDVERFATDHVAAARRQGIGWRAALDGLRPVTSELWRRLPLEQRRAFIDGPARQWEVLRHRMAPPVADAVAAMIAEGSLTVIGAEVLAAVGEERRWRVTIRRAGLLETVQVAAVVNCTGPTCDIERFPGGLGRQLVSRGLVTPDPLRLGIVTSDDGSAVGADGTVDPRLRTLGALRRGSLYESAAVPELREQARDLARDLAAVLLGGAATSVPRGAGRPADAGVAQVGAHAS